MGLLRIFADQPYGNKTLASTSVLTCAIALEEISIYHSQHTGALLRFHCSTHTRRHRARVSTKSAKILPFHFLWSLGTVKSCVGTGRGLRKQSPVSLASVTFPASLLSRAHDWRQHQELRKASALAWFVTTNKNKKASARNETKIVRKEHPHRYNLCICKYGQWVDEVRVHVGHWWMNSSQILKLFRVTLKHSLEPASSTSSQQQICATCLNFWVFVRVSFHGDLLEKE